MIYIIGIILIIGISYLIYKAYKNTHDIKINKIKATSKKSGQESLSILHLSDLHLENISLTPAQLANTLKKENVDLIALTGDFLDRKRSIPKLIPYLQVLEQMQPMYGCFAVLGNHDYVLKDKDLAHLIEVLERHHCQVLRNESYSFSVNQQIINIIGIDDYSTDRSNLTASFKHVNDGTNIVLTHDPTIALDMKDYTYDYLMAGHFHGGQICYPKAYHLVKMGNLARQNIIKGLHTVHEKPLYISEGLGQTGINIRIGSRPEITFHNIAL